MRFVGDPERARTAGPTQPGLGLAVCHPRPTVVEIEDEGFPCMIVIADEIVAESPVAAGRVAMKRTKKMGYAKLAQRPSCQRLSAGS